MFAKETLDKNRILEQRWKEKSKDLLGKRKLNLNTSSGIELKSLYTPKDLADLDYDEVGLPGEYPCTRGNYSLQYQITPFIQSQFFGFGTAEETRQRRDWLERLGCSYRVGEKGQVPLIIAFDLPSQKGLDPDHPEARGRIGQGGVSISTIRDIAAIMEGLPLDKTCVFWNCFDAALPVYALYFVYALDVRKEPLENLFIMPSNYSCNQWGHDWIGFPPPINLKLEVELIKFIIENCPLSRDWHSTLDGYDPAEAGATPVQEVAFGLGRIIMLIEECKKVGLNPDDIAPGFWGHPHISLNFFEEIAKLRATRKIWAKIMKERFGCRRPESWKLKVPLSETAGIELTAREPFNNIVRLTIMTLAGILANVEGIFTAAYDEAISIPTEESAKMSVRTQQIIAEETDVCKITDPLGGSYYIEWLTNRIEKEVNDLLAEIDEKGGFLKCWESGWIRREIEESSNKRQEKIQNGEKVIVGVNKYEVEDKTKIPPFRVSLDIEKGAIEKVKKHKENRDNLKTERALAGVREAAQKMDKEWPESCGLLTPAMVEAAGAGATMGEMHGVLRDVFGWGFFSG